MPTLLDRWKSALVGDTADLAATCRQVARPLQRAEDLDPLLEQIGDARYVLMGEASHGTSDYYLWRYRLSQRLIREKGFSFIAVEGDWPDSYRVNRYVKGYSDSGGNAREVLQAFARWPTWMWANEEVVALADWLRQHNTPLEASRKVGFYGLDVYSLWESMEAVIGYLERVDPEAARKAKANYGCFEPYNEEGQNYAWATMFVPTSCEEEAIAILHEMRRNLPRHTGDGHETSFNAEQNALVVQNAERYYRTMVRGGPDSWNVRDRHMVETLERLMQLHGPDAKAIVWEHNTHIGDARFTDMASDGMVNVGQLVREHHAAEHVYLVGFGSYAGSVIAGSAWGAPMERVTVPPAQEGTWEAALHLAKPQNQLLLLSDLQDNREALASRGHRAIGVVYNPTQERYGNYVPSVLPRRYDAFLYLDTSQALHPLHIPSHPDGEPPDTYPWNV
ncbi:MAG: protein-L-isoaspartate O-methyltransferase [Chthonomonadales bacterium]|nr:protein-L-isoaspartate O-methyltransferase [Chthonomonadales bacterium]